MILTVTGWSVAFFFICVAIFAGVSLKRSRVFSILFIAFLLRFAFAIYAVFSSQGSYYDGDGLISRAEDFSNMDTSSLLGSMPFSAYIYSWIIGLVWHTIGSADIMLVSLMNALLSFLCCVLAYDLSMKLYSKKTATIIILVVAIFPTLLLQSAGYANRESFFILPLLGSLILAYEYYIKGRLSALLGSIVLAIIASIIHTVGIVLFAFILIICFKNRRGHYRQILRILAPAAVMLLVYGLFSSGIGTEKFYDTHSATELVGSIQETRASGRAAYLQGIEINNLSDMILYGPVKLLYFIMAPLVWMVRNVSDVYGMLDGLVYLGLLIMIIKSGIFKGKMRDERSRYLRYVANAIIAMVIVLSLGTANYGTAMRHRAKLFIPLLIVAGLRIEQTSMTNHTRRRAI